jgi:hypothetical protein
MFNIDIIIFKKKEKLIFPCSYIIISIDIIIISSNYYLTLDIIIIFRKK